MNDIRNTANKKRRLNERPTTKNGVKRKVRSGFVVVDTQKSDHIGTPSAVRPRTRRSTDLSTEENTQSRLQPNKGIFALGSWQKITVLCIGVLVLICMSLYTPLRDLYIAKRESAIKEQILEQANEQNEAYLAEIQRLQTTEGIKDEARQRGLVEKGEVAVEVEGLEDSAHENKDTPSAQDEKYTEQTQMFGKNYTVKTDWKTQILDFIFMYTPEKPKE